MHRGRANHKPPRSFIIIYYLRQGIGWPGPQTNRLCHHRIRQARVNWLRCCTILAAYNERIVDGYLTTTLSRSCAGRDFVHRAERLPMTDAAKRFSALHNRCKCTSMNGATASFSGGLILSFRCRPAKPPAASPARRPGSSTANRSRRPRAAGRRVPMRQEDQGAQAPCRDRYHRPAGRCRGPSRRHSGSRGAGLVIEAVHSLFPWLRHLFADSAYAGDKLRNRLAEFGDWTIELVKRPATAVGFQLLPRRWVVERTLAWLNRNRRLAKDFEASLASATAWIYIASMQLLVRRLA